MRCYARTCSIAFLGLTLVATALAAGGGGEAQCFVVERDMPGSRNLIPIVNRTTMVGLVSGESVDVRISQMLPSGRCSSGPHWPAFGDRARMSIPVDVPEGFPLDITDLGQPEILERNGATELRWTQKELEPATSIAVMSDTFLGPPDIYHTASGQRFGDLVLIERIRATQLGVSSSLTFTVMAVNRGESAIDGLELALFVPHALLDYETGGKQPLLLDPEIRTRGLDDAPIEFLISDGLARPAWGYRAVVRREQLAPGESLRFSMTIEGEVLHDEKIVPLVNYVGRAYSRHLPSSEVTLSRPLRISYHDYTHFNLVVSSSRFVELKKDGQSRVRASAPLLREVLPLDGDLSRR